MRKTWTTPATQSYNAPIVTRAMPPGRLPSDLLSAAPEFDFDSLVAAHNSVATQVSNLTTQVNAIPPTLTFVDAETPTVTTSGSNTLLTLLYGPDPLNSVQLYGGATATTLALIAASQYTVAGNVITIPTATVAVLSVFSVNYRRKTVV
jgi:hypothetical protein